MTEKVYFLDQHGCAKNQVDAEQMIAVLACLGWKKTEDPACAKLIIVNSCGFIEPAKKESIDAVITARVSCPGAKVLLAGCLAERYADDLAGQLSEADGFFGNGDISRINEILEKLFPEDSDKREQPVLTPPQRGIPQIQRHELLSFPRSAYLKITEGCDNHCSFCAIPLIRGSLRSRTIDDIRNEAQDLVSRGIFEINIIGQDLASYGRGSEDSFADSSESPLASLLRSLSTLSGDFWIRLLYIHPDNFPLDILPVIQGDERFLPYFDIPFQSADPAILAKMNRRGSADIYRALVAQLRHTFSLSGKGRSFLALRTTILTGFPGESDESFELTARFLADIRPLWSGSFTYSPEEGTVAAEFKKKVPKKTALARAAAFKELQTRITEEELAVFIGQELTVLVEEVIPDQGSPDPADPVPPSRLALGRAWFQAPEVDGSVVLQFEAGQTGVDGESVCAGSVVKALVIAVHGVDVEAVVQ